MAGLTFGQAGQRDRLIALLAPQPGARGLGGAVNVAHVEAAEEYAQFLPMRAGEADKAGTTTAGAEGKFVIPWRDDVTADWRLRDEYGATWEITGTEEQGRRAGLIIFAKVAR